MPAHAKDWDTGTYINSGDIEGRDGYPLRVPGRGVFPVISAKSDRGNGKECKIDRSSLIELILASDFRAPKSGYAAEKKSIKMKGVQQGDEIVCNGSGDGCTVIITVWDPDDPVLPK